MQVRKDQKGLNTTKDRDGDSKISEASSSRVNLETEKKNFLDITALIRSIQRAEGHTDCFRKGIIDCDQFICKWRYICVEGKHVLNEE